MRPDLVPRWAGGTSEMRIVLVLGLAAILVAGCVGSGAASPAPNQTPPSSAPSGGPSSSPERTLGPTPLPSVPASPTARPLGPTQEPLPDVLPAGATVITITDGLRVRSRPDVDVASIKYAPLLPDGTPLLVRDGPVAGSGYWWYRVEIPLSAGFRLSGGNREGWVAAADHDGTPWIGRAGWPSVTGSGITMTGIVEYDDVGFDGLSVTLTGLGPGESVAFDATAEYSLTWTCGTQPGPCGDLGCGPADWQETAGEVSIGAKASADRLGTVTTRIEFTAPAPAESCTDDPGAPWGVHRYEWVLTVADPGHGLVLRSEPIGGGVIF